MSTTTKRSRREFLRDAGAVSAAAYMRMLAPGAVAIAQAACSARDDGRSFAVLGADEAADYAAIAARIMPTTDTPGASEVGVIHFIDRAFGAEMSNVLESAREQLSEFNAALGNARFADLDEQAQDEFLRSREDTPLFNLLWALTMFGFFSMPKYGGNLNNMGWELIGFEGDHGAWQYPFGHYDAAAHEESNDGNV